MAKTITTTKKDNGVFTLAEINDLFTEIAEVLNNKVDKVEGSVLSSILDLGTKQVINVPDPVELDDAVPLRFAENYASGADKPEQAALALEGDEAVGFILLEDGSFIGLE